MFYDDRPSATVANAPSQLTILERLENIEKSLDRVFHEPDSLSTRLSRIENALGLNNLRVGNGQSIRG